MMLPLAIFFASSLAALLEGDTCQRAAKDMIIPGPNGASTPSNAIFSQVPRLQIKLVAACLCRPPSTISGTCVRRIQKQLETICTHCTSEQVLKRYKLYFSECTREDDARVQQAGGNVTLTTWQDDLHSLDHGSLDAVMGCVRSRSVPSGPAGRHILATMPRVEAKSRYACQVAGRNADECQRTTLDRLDRLCGDGVANDVCLDWMRQCLREEDYWVQWLSGVEVSDKWFERNKDQVFGSWERLLKCVGDQVQQPRRAGNG